MNYYRILKFKKSLLLTISWRSTFPSLVNLISPEPDTNLYNIQYSYLLRKYINDIYIHICNNSLLQ